MSREENRNDKRNKKKSHRRESPVQEEYENMQKKAKV